ncbi:MAG: glycogen/starch/alpha-glucan phosphorylase [Clostridia bacterium]|nr:glycogen/starch/alpha-glucan phosphorylase [Clostridia bacterium]
MGEISTNEFKEKINKYMEINFGSDLSSGNERQVYQAVIGAVNEILAEKRYKYRKKVKASDAKQVYYMSMEFLVGTSLKNNLWNLGIESEVKDLLLSYGYDITRLYDIEPDAGLGNGGLGRLASCYMDSLTTLSYPATGFSIRYEFGIFKQIIKDGWQIEFPDEWLELGGYWLLPRYDEAVTVRFFGEVSERWTHEGLKTELNNSVEVTAMPYDLLISGHNTECVNTLRLWGAKSKEGFDMDLFAQGEHGKASEKDAILSSISKVLYPADENYNGKSLRIKQQYFFVSASLQQITKKHFDKYKTFDNLPDKVVIHINDTHPSFSVAELMRILLDDYGYVWERAWDITCRTLAYTNHTVMSEALEKWSVELIKSHLPRIYTIIEEINRRFCSMIYENYPQYAHSLNEMSIISSGMVKMANLCMVCCFSVNGVSKLHSEILKKDTFSDFNRVFPSKITNVTNGIAYRRWLCQANPKLTELLTEKIGDEFLYDLSKLSGFKHFKEDSEVLERLRQIKYENKLRLADYISKSMGISVNCNSIFDVQVKRLHEYKRQLLKALHIIYLYKKIKNEGARPYPKTFIFAAKASKGYVMAKEIIRLICTLSEMIEKDASVRDYMKVVFIPDYKVSLAEIIIPAADISEQISQAGKEASGTGNMKLMINGAVTCGTMDGANVEIFESVGKDNMFIFGLSSDEVEKAYKDGYSPKRFYENDAELKDVLEALVSGELYGKRFESIYHSLKNSDPFMCLADFRSYVNVQERIEEKYKMQDDFTKMSLENIAGAGIFSSDRSIKEYAEKIWRISPVK